MVKFIRVSTGTAITLGLTKLKSGVAPTTAYLMINHEGKCSANCSFCPQSRSTQGKDSFLSRITWPRFPFPKVITSLIHSYLKKILFRACIQTINYPALVPDLLEVVAGIRRECQIPLSVAVHPLQQEDFRKLKNAGVGRVGIAFDGCTPKIFNRVKGVEVGGPYRWEGHLAGIRAAVDIFGSANVATHFIVGLGETEKEMLQTIQEVVNMGVMPSLFAFTPITGTREQDRPQPTLVQYRKMQLGRELIVNRGVTVDSFVFSTTGSVQSFQISEEEFQDIIAKGEAFQTRGCPHCNRPYYDSRPGKVIYNYGGELTKAQKLEVDTLLNPFK